MAQSQDLKSLVRKVFEGAMNEGNVQALGSVFAPSCVVHRPPFPDLVGLDALRKHLTDARASYPDVKVTVEDVLIDGDRGAMRYAFRGTQKGASPTTGVAPTGKAITYTARTVSHFKDGKIVESWDHSDWLGLMQQLGVVPKAPAT